MSENLIKEMLAQPRWAVLGATPNPEKTANRIVHKLVEHGYHVTGINPNYTQVDGIKCYADIEEMPQSPQVIDIVVPAERAKKIIEKLDPKQIKYLWFQPGTFDDDVLTFAKEKGFFCVGDGSCVMVALGLK